MASGSEILLTQQQHSDLSSIAQSRTPPAGYVFRAKLILMLAEAASFNAIKRQLQTTAPTIVRWKQRFWQHGLEGLDNLSSRPRTQCAHSGSARPHPVRHAEKTQRRVHALELPQTGLRAGRQQRRRASGLARSGPQAAPPRTLHGERRSRVRNQSGRHPRPLSAPAPTRCRVLRR